MKRIETHDHPGSFYFMLYKLLIDFGLVILIWMTQLVIYPSFTYFSTEDLFRWHQKYTTAISIIVMPLMIGQLGLHIHELVQLVNWWRLLALILVILAWINTFLFAVPLHNKIADQQAVMESASNLVGVNWYRTTLWTIVFLLTLTEYLEANQSV